MLNPMLLIVIYFICISFCDSEFSNEMPTDIKRKLSIDRKQVNGKIK